MTNAVFNFGVTMPGADPIATSAQVPVEDAADVFAAFASEANVRVNGTATSQQIITEMRDQFITMVSAKVLDFRRARALAALPDPNPITVIVD